jgi:hypothetical protein
MNSGQEFFVRWATFEEIHASQIILRECASALANFARVLQVVLERVLAAESALARGTLDVALVLLQVAPQILHSSERLVAEMARGFAIVRANVRRAIAFVSVAPLAERAVEAVAARHYVDLLRVRTLTGRTLRGGTQLLLHPLHLLTTGREFI